MKKLIAITLLFTIIAGACKTTEPVKNVPPAPSPAKTGLDCTNLNTSYAVDIKPIMEKYCAECHGSAGGYNLTAFSEVTRSAKDGSLLSVIKWQFGYPRMPAEKDQLDKATIDKIECWINNGLKP